MPLRLDIRRKLSTKSDRVKCVDLHPHEPWMLAALYNGKVHIWNYQTSTLLKTVDVTELPIRSAQFVARKQWFVAGSDDMQVRVFNYNTMEKIKAFEAHSDYIRCTAVHPSLPLLLTSSDDMTIKMWDWDKQWTCTQTFEGHSHYVMQVVFNPKDPNTFASASLDRTVKVWGISSPNAHFTLEGHDKGVNCVDYFTGGDKPFLITGADDRTAKIWDYQSRTCVQTLDGHTNNVSVVKFHPDLPLIITGSEDGGVRLWHTNTYRLENALNYGFERVWSIGVAKGSNKVALGFDEGAVMIKLGREEPVASMDSSGKIIYARHNVIQSVNLKAAAHDTSADGERIQLASKELGNCEVYPQSLLHSPNGRFVSVCGDGEHIIYTALAWRNKSFGSAHEFVWGLDGDYATRENNQRIKLFRDFKERASFTPPFTPDGIFGGALLGVRSSVKDEECIFFYDWEHTKVVRRIDVCVKNVFWSDSGELVAIASEASFFILRFNRDKVDEYLAGGVEDEEGCEDAFEMQHEFGEKVRTAKWLGECFVYTNAADRVNYCVGGKVQTLQHLDRRMYLLGYLPKDNRLYLIDKEFNIVSFSLLLAVLEYKTAVVRGDLDAAQALLPSIPADQHNSIARFLEAQGHKHIALTISNDPDYKFDLAIQLDDLDTAFAIAQDHASEQKWRQLGDLALSQSKLELAKSCMIKANDVNGLLLLATSLGDVAGLEQVAQLAREARRDNAAFAANWLLRRPLECIEILRSSGRVPEAAIMAKVFCPGHASGIVNQWKSELAYRNPKAAEAIADPAQYPNLFPDYDLGVLAEKEVASRAGRYPPAKLYRQFVDRMHDNLIDKVRALKESGALAATEHAQEEEQQEEETAKEASPTEDLEQPNFDDEPAPIAAAKAASPAKAPEPEPQPQEEEEAEAEEEEVVAAPAPAPAPAAAAPAAASGEDEVAKLAAELDLEEPDWGDD